MVSLCELMEVTEEGVKFVSPHDGSLMMLTPEHSIQLQNSIGALVIDILVQKRKCSWSYLFQHEINIYTPWHYSGWDIGLNFTYRHPPIFTVKDEIFKTHLKYLPFCLKITSQEPFTCCTLWSL